MCKGLDTSSLWPLSRVIVLPSIAWTWRKSPFLKFARRLFFVMSKCSPTVTVIDVEILGLTQRQRPLPSVSCDDHSFREDLRDLPLLPGPEIAFQSTVAFDHLAHLIIDRIRFLRLREITTLEPRYLLIRAAQHASAFHLFANGAREIFSIPVDRCDNDRFLPGPKFLHRIHYQRIEDVRAGI